MYLPGPSSEPSLATLVLAHGAGAPMDSPFMNAMAERLQKGGIAVARFEFPYMAARRIDGRRRPPDRQPILLEKWREVVVEHQALQPLFIGGKSMGGRMASLIACESLPVRGLLCLGFPFHPPGKPEKCRLEHWPNVRCPALVLQGERDPFGRRAEVERYQLPHNVSVSWIPDGDHDFSPTRRSGLSQRHNLDFAAEEMLSFIQSLC